ncbi:MAG: beta-galactosidase [Rikenellaceae bacterium]
MNLKKLVIVGCLSLLALAGYAQPSEKDCKKKISKLEKLIKEAQKQEIDTQREECAVWMAETFLQYAAWDEKNVSKNAYQYTTWAAFADDAGRLARELPDFERGEIEKLLDTAIEEITAVINGDVLRREVPKIDWKSIKLEGSQFVSNGRPVFINDYFTKPTFLDNDYCGQVNHGRMSLGDVDLVTGELTASGNKRINSDNGNSGYILLWHGNPPQSIMEQDPNVNDGGRHFTKYDIDNPLIREAWSTTFKTVVPLVKDRLTTDQGYILSNEPHWFTMKDVWATGIVSHYTIDKFKTWLEAKHGNIERLNELWGTSFASFNDVTIEIPFDGKYRTEPMGYDWMTFNQDRVVEWFTFLRDGIRKYDLEAVIHIKLIPRMFREDIRDHGLDFESLVNLGDILGNDAKIQGRMMRSTSAEAWESDYCFNWFEVGIGYDFFESVSPGKTNVNSESHYLSSAGWRDIYLTPGYARAAYWLATLQGMGISYSWFWAREADGGIRYDLRGDKKWNTAMDLAYVASVAQQPSVANEVTKTYMNMNAFSPEIATLQDTERPSRIFYSKVSAIKNTKYVATMLDLYTPLFFSGTPVGFATEKVIKDQDNDSWSVIMVRETEFVTESELAALQSYLDNGGTILLDSKSLKKNEYGEPLSTTLTASKGTLLKVDSVDEFLAKNDEILKSAGSAPRVMVAETNSCSTEGCLWRSYAKDDNTTILCILNIGNSDATLNLSSDKGLFSMKNMFTSKSVKSELTLKKQDVIMIEVTHKSAGFDNW